MEKKEKTGLFSKIFGGFNKQDCCSLDLEEVPVENQNSEKGEDGVAADKKDNDSCNCGCQ